MEGYMHPYKNLIDTKFGLAWLENGLLSIGTDLKLACPSGDFWSILLSFKTDLGLETRQNGAEIS